MSQLANLTARYPALTKITSLPKPALLGIGAGLIAVLVVLALWSRGPEYRVLFSNLQDRDGGAIVTALTQMNVPYQFSENGSALLVPAERVHETRLQLAQQGLPRSGDVGFELLQTTRFGASQFTEQVTYQRALEGELSNSIKALHSVQDARVHLAIPRESLFVRQRQAPTASVLLTLHPGRSLNPAQVSAITWLVSSSVPNLNSDNVSVVDQNGRLLTSPPGDAGVDGTQRSFINDLEQRTAQRIITLLTPIVGAGNVRAQASADVDFSLREQTSEVYRPNQKPGEAAVRSEQTSASDQYDVAPPIGVPGALTNQPPVNPVAPIVTPPAQPGGANAAANQAGAQANGAAAGVPAAGAPAAGAPGNSRRDATINYEVDRTISHVKDPTGKLRRLTVAVVLNYQRNSEGESVPLPAEQLAQLNALVKDAMGYSEARGDTLTLVNSEFSENRVVEPPVWMNPDYQALALAIGKYLLLALAVFLVWRKIVRPLVQSAVSSKDNQLAERETPPNNPELELAAQSEAEALKRAAAMSRYEENLQTARTMAEKDPRAVAMVLRSWMEKKDGK